MTFTKGFVRMVLTLFVIAALDSRSVLAQHKCTSCGPGTPCFGTDVQCETGCRCVCVSGQTAGFTSCTETNDGFCNVGADCRVAVFIAPDLKPVLVAASELCPRKGMRATASLSPISLGAADTAATK